MEQATVAVKIRHPSSIHREAQIMLHLGNVLPRSRLYGLEPREVGTVWSECLTSYLNRLGWRHGVSPRDLVIQELLPFLNKRISYQQLSGFSRSRAMNINGNGTTAREWAKALEQLTTRPDLHFLTLQWWIGDLLPSQLLREKPTWCPACFAQWKDQKMPIYEPLLWTFQVVTVCMKHHRKLEDYCPYCERQQPFIRVQTALDQCSRCNTWLGSSTPASDPLNPEVIAWQRWVLDALEELHSAVVSSGIPSWEQFFTNLSMSFEARGEQSRLAELAGLARGQFARWLRRSCTPSLQSILEFCYVCDVTPLQVLTGNLTPLKRVIQEGKPSRLPRSRRSYRPVDREYCLKRIQAILDGREEPLGYVQLAEQLGYSGHVLLYHFPQECALLTKQVQEYRRLQKEQRQEQVENEIRQAILAIHTQGVYPSQNKVADRLSDPNLFFQPEVKAIWRAQCQELGWHRENSPVL
jgi:transcriptional regulator with XRE-family HTH domain